MHKGYALKVGGILALAGLALAGCGGGNSGSGNETPTGYEVSGSVDGLDGTLVLSNNGMTPVTVTANGTYTLYTDLPDGTAYHIVVDSQPAGQHCTVAGESGTLSHADVTSVAVHCRTFRNIGGNVYGLNGSLSLSLNDTEELALSANGPFTFSTQVLDGDSFTATRVDQPAMQSCLVTGGTGTPAGSDIDTISVVCQDTYSVGGSITGLGDDQVELTLGDEFITIMTDGAFNFFLGLVNGAVYDVQISAQPETKFCEIANGYGVMANSNVSDIAIDCSDTYRIGGIVSGLNGSLVLASNNVGEVTIEADGQFTFPNHVLDEVSFDVFIQSQPTNQRCSIENGAGSGPSDVTNVMVSCITLPPFKVGGEISGLSGTLVLALNDQQILAINENGSYNFPGELPGGSAYSVVALTVPPELDCAVANADGNGELETVVSADVSCAPGEPGTWGIANRIELASTNTESLVLAVSSSGDAAAAWTQTLGNRVAIYVNRYIHGSGWQVPQPVDTGGTSNSMAPRIAINAGGEILAAWSQYDGTSFKVRANHFVPGSGWQGDIALENSTASPGAISVVLNDAGNGAVAWSKGSPQQVFVRSYSTESGWGSATLIDTGALGDLAITPTGTMMLTWWQSGKIRAAGYNMGWAPAVTLATATSLLSPSIAMDNDGNAIATWSQHDGTNWRIYAAHYIAGVGWGSPSILDSGSDSNIGGTIVMNPAGDAAVAWQQYIPGTTDNTFRLNRYIDGVGWQGEEVLGAPATPDTAGTIAIDSNSNVMALWRQGPGGASDKLYASYHKAGGSWATVADVSGMEGAGYLREIGFDGAGNALAIWVNTVNDANNIFFNLYRHDN